MERRSQTLRRIYLLSLLLVPGALFVWIGVNSTHHFETLDHYGPKKLRKVSEEGSTPPDTIYHKVPDFSFVDRKGNERHLKGLEGKAILVEFFQNETLLKRVAVEFRGFRSIHFLSVLTDTSMSGRELRQYTDHIGVDTLRWTFARAPMERIEQFAIKGCFKGAAPPDTIRRLIKHPVMVLLDDEYHVRGIYEGPHANEVERAIKEIRLLMKELDQKKNPS